MLLLSAEDPRSDINLWINSPGGSVPAMLAIHDVMRIIPNDVSTLAMGLACSAGQFLLSAEDARADISLWINSPGGSVPAMLAIHDAMRLVPNDVSTLALG
ncbi:ClpP family protease, partial [Roseibium denhamense]|uniref:ClpP family protease n=1 Tax=Roseibium denhamense TaxID=76305 RepID=UPI003CD0B9BD